MLTTSERETLVLAARGFSHKQIALERNLTVQTVKNHLWAIYRKLDTGSLVETLNKLGWIQIPQGGEI